MDGLAFVLEMLQALIGAKSLHHFDQLLTQRLKENGPCDAAGLYLYNEAAHAFTPVSPLLLEPGTPGYEIGQLPPQGTVKEAAVRQGRAIRCDDIGATDWAEGQVARNSGLSWSTVVAPLLVTPADGGPGRTIGVMFAGRFVSGIFSEDDRRLLEALAAQIAPVLETVLAAEERDVLMEISRRVVVGTLSVENLLPAITPTLMRVMPHDAHALIRFVQEPSGPWFEKIFVHGIDLDLDALRRFPFERTAPAYMRETGRPVIIMGWDDRARFAEAPHFEALGLHSCMLCPLTVRGEPYGFLALGSRRRNAFSERSLRLAEQIGHHLSHAIANLSAYDEVRALKEQFEQENVYLRDEIRAAVDVTELIGDSAALQRALKAIEKVAPTDSTVLITGETGTGKELVAQAVHQLSPRKAKPLITVNCAALPPTLIESELFGHEKGAFTGATTRKLGRFELADRGTLFLDEVGEIPLDLQAKLLRVLEVQELERVGGSRTLRVNVRVLAATNTDLAQAVKNGTFRKDLYYRLRVFPIALPPLRERREDIPALARHFAKKYAARHRKPVTRIAAPALRALAAYDWPGNVRELEHVIERAVILAQGPSLTLEELGGEFAADGAACKLRESAALADVERAHILDVLHRTRWVVAGRHGAAATLGLKRSTLQHRMKKLGIKKPAGRRS